MVFRNSSNSDSVGLNLRPYLKYFRKSIEVYHHTSANGKRAESKDSASQSASLQLHCMANSKPERLDHDPEVDAEHNIHNAEENWKGGKKGIEEKCLNIHLHPAKTPMGKMKMPIIVTTSHGRVVEPFPVAAVKIHYRLKHEIGRIIIHFLSCVTNWKKD